VLTRAKRDHYAVLGVPRDADRDAIKKAFRSLASAYHPDVSTVPDAEERFREIVDAYDVLSDPAARLRYDRRGFTRRTREAAGEPTARGLDDLLDMVADEGGAPDVLVELELNRVEARRGATRGVRFVSWGTCQTCSGRGASARSRWRTCGACGGSRRVRESGRSPNGRLIRFQSCGRCNGLGRLADDPCTSCASTGRMEEDRALLVRVPAGARNGQELRVAGQGNTGGPGAPAGDVVVRLRVSGGSRRRFGRRADR
jgi:molecular chaperone DnaJ